MTDNKKLSKNILNMKFMQKANVKQEVKEEKTFAWYARYFFNKFNTDKR